MPEIIPSTYAEAIQMGYKVGDFKFTPGYKTRKNWDKMTEPVTVAGGTRKGELFIRVPCWKSTRYHYRLYLYKD